MTKVFYDLELDELILFEETSLSYLISKDGISWRVLIKDGDADSITSAYLYYSVRIQSIGVL